MDIRKTKPQDPKKVKRHKGKKALQNSTLLTDLTTNWTNLNQPDKIDTMHEAILALLDIADSIEDSL